MDRIERIDSLEEVREDWDRLARGAGHVFATWEWIGPWWRHMARGRELYAYACRDGEGDVFAILPLYVAATRPLRIARFIGYGDINSPICMPEDRRRAARLLRTAIGAGRGKCSLLLAENLPEGEAWRPLLGASLLSERPDPVIEIAGMSWEQYLASRSRRFRKRCRQQERRLQRDHELSYRLAGAGESLDADIETLVRLHLARWGEQRTGMFDGPRGRAVRESLRLAAERGWLRLWLMELDGETIAADLAWRWNGSEWAMNSGRDPAYDESSVGAVLMAHAVREACEDGVAAYRLLQGDDEYKLKYATAVPTTRTMLVGPRPLVASSRAAVRLVSALPRETRGSLRRLLG